MTTVLISDFDGTLTDPTAEELVFMAQCVRSLSVVTGLTRRHVQRIIHRVHADMRTRPERYDWEFRGHTVSSLVGDPYLRIIAIARAVAAETERSLEGRDLARELLSEHYPTTSMFRPGAAQFLTQPGIATHVVTNSTEAKVGRKLRRLLDSGFYDSRCDAVLKGLRGSAGKQHIDPEFDVLPESMTIPGLNRSVLLRRREYFETLSAIRNDHGARWEGIAVIGDNFELDLAVPWALGSRIILITNAWTPPWEITFVRGYERGSVATTLDEAAQMLRR